MLAEAETKLIALTALSSRFVKSDFKILNLANSPAAKEAEYSWLKLISL